MSKKTRPSNWWKHAQGRKEGVPNIFNKDQKPDPYQKNNPLKGEGDNMVTPGSEDSALGVGDISSPSFGGKTRGNYVGQEPSGVSQFEDPADKGSANRYLPDGKQEEGSPFNLRAREDGEGLGIGTDTGHGLLLHGDEVGTNASTEAPLGVHDTVSREMSGTADRKFPFNNMNSGSNIFGLVRRRTR